MASATIAYFEEIYITTHPTRVEEVMNLLPPKVTMEMNAELTRDFTMEEVRTALRQIHPTKAPGLDDMLAIFYQKYWDVVGINVTNMVLNVLNSNAPISDINNTNIALVPKVKSPTRMKDFHPISPSNVCYKLISCKSPEDNSSTNNLRKPKCILIRKVDNR